MFNHTTVNIAPVVAKPGDTIIVSSDRPLSADQLYRLRKQLASDAPGVKAIMLDEGLHAKVHVQGNRE